MLKKALFSLTLLSSISINAYALPQNNNHIVVAPHCLVKSLTVDYKTLSANDSLSLIEINNAGIRQLIEAKHQQKSPCGGFMDVTDEWQGYKVTSIAVKNPAGTFLSQYANPVKNKLAERSSKYTIQFKKQVRQLVAAVNKANIWSNLTTLSNFENRYANSDKGVEAANWIKSHIEAIAKEYNRSDVTIFTVDTHGYKQPSVVAKIGTSSEPGVVIGGHMDTISFFGSRQPGADDDGSGSMSILEAARAILASGMQFKKPIYFIWYAAEEEGLIGSQQVVRHFKANNIPVSAALQFDMTGYQSNNDPTLWLLDDNVNTELTTFLDQLVQTYVKQPVGHTRCGYGCSDHASWHKAGFTAAAPFEAKYGQENKNIHSSRDTMDLLSDEHMANFAKLAVAAAVELAQPAT